MFLFREKMRESTSSILPIAAIILLLSLTLTPLSSAATLLFVTGVVFLIVGLSVFTIGAEMSMQPLGQKIGAHMASSGKVWLIALISFVIGIVVTVSEPDLQILAEQVPDIQNMVLILSVSVGVGVFLVIAILRIFFRVNLKYLLCGFYTVAIVLSFFLPASFRPLAFDSGGVTTGPMTVPFFLSLGAGVSASRTTQDDSDDSFGITALASIGPIIAVLILGLVLGIEGGSYEVDSAATVIGSSRDLAVAYGHGLRDYAPEVLVALCPMVVFTLLFQLLTHSFARRQLIRIGVGVLYTFVGLTVFLTGANIGFMPTGTEIGQRLASLGGGALLIPVMMLLGYFIVKAEPAVFVLNKLVEQMSAGAISGKTTGLGLSIGVAAALGLSGVRLLTGISILWILIPGYLLALVLSFFVPNIFVGIAFDSGGVASGTMMSGFVLPMAIGACGVLGGDVMADAFGCVAFVAMAPIIAIEVMGVLYRMNSKKNIRRFISTDEDFVDYGYELQEEVLIG